MVDNNQLGRRVRQFRVARNGRSQEAMEMLAEEVGIQTATLRNYENGVVIPAAFILELINLGANPNFLLTGEGEPLVATTNPSSFPSPS